MEKTAKHAAVALQPETRSIDYVPQAERHGKPWHQAPFWFTGQFVPTTMVVGFIGPVMGLSFLWSVVATVLGVLFGTCFMAFHANQGPTMGLPQMIQSRAQFGTRGASLPMIAVIGVYLGFSSFGVLLGSQTLAADLGWSTTGWSLVIVVLTTALAIFGYDLLHLVLRWLPYLVVPVFAALTVLAVVHLDPAPAASGGGFSVSGWLAQFAAATGYQLGYAVYVSDYSRYLPATTSHRAVIGWTYLGAAASALWLMPLGNLIASSVEAPDALVNLQQVGDFWFDGFGQAAVLIVLIPGVIAIMGVNLYGAMLSSLSIVQGFKPDLGISSRNRVLGIVAGAVLVFSVSEWLPAKYLGSFNDFVLVVTYLLVPWTAVNLVDYYFVRRGHYAVTEIFSRDGIYGRWAWRGLSAYLLGVAALAPFASTGFYKGPLLDDVGGADLAFIVGLVVPAVAYFAISRGFDPRTEADAAARSRYELDGATAVARGSGAS
ncbi:purine-cytosine permease family protein [Actinomadura chibensis]|uniref:Cytosine permease n=1 Tax=Actinomadura chibensis TaxID=392828 RepID=A0A5D0NQ15_9ACTN|nr:cytosine permease [Actinomadura chibensis]TYB46345.1 cytosine permease [Actinomadura chibensis]